MESAPKKKRTRRKPASAAPYVAMSGRGYDVSDGMKKLEGGTVKVLMSASLGYARCALNVGDVALLPADIAEAYIKKQLAEGI